MKAKKAFKLLAFAISLVLLVAMAVGITVSAEEEAPVIYSKNFAYEDTTYIYYAVKATENVTANNTTLTIYSDAECTNALQSDIVGTADNIPMLGDVIVFRALPIKAKDITKVIYAQADTDGTKSAVVAYSLAEYLYERLYVAERQGLSVLDEEKAFYESLLKYGASAQNLFNNHGKPDAEKEVLATDYNIVKVFDGNLTTGGTQKLVESGATVTATPKDNAQTKWEVIKIADDGTVTKTYVAIGEEITVDSHTIIQNVKPLTFDTNADLGFFGLTTAYGESSIESTVEKGQKTVELEIVDGALVLDSPVYHNNVITVNRTVEGTGTKAVFEADVTIDVGDANSSASTGESLWINFIFYDPTTGTAYSPFEVLLADGGTSATVTSQGESKTVTDLIKDNVKFTLRLEYLINTSGYNNTYIYIKPEGATEFDNTLVRSTKNAVTSGRPTANDVAFKIEVNRFEECALTLDNVTFKNTDLTFDTSGDKGYFSVQNGGYKDSDITSDYQKGQQTVTGSIVDGAFQVYSPIYHNTPVVISRTGNTKGTKAVFEADITLDMESYNKNAEAAGAWVYFSFYNGSTSYTPFYIQLKDGNEYALITKDAALQDTEDYRCYTIKDGETFHLRLEYYINPSNYNNTLVYIKAPGATEWAYTGRSTRATCNTSAPAPDTMGFKIELQRSEGVTLTLDNVRFDGE